MSVKGSECQVSKLVNSDTCPSPTTRRAGRGRERGRRRRHLPSGSNTAKICLSSAGLKASIARIRSAVSSSAASMPRLITQ